MANREIYTHVSVRYGKVYYRGYEWVDGKRKRVHAKVDFSPDVYMETQDKSSPYKSLYGKPLAKRKSESIPSTREFHKNNGDILKLYGYNPSRWSYEFIARNFPGKIEAVASDLTIVAFDIETKVGTNGPPGVPDPYQAVEEITHIAFQNRATGRSRVITTASVTKQDEYDYELIVCEDEEELLTEIIKYMNEVDPDILTAWYCDGFDTPYIINRMRNVMGEEFANKLSPFGIIDERDVKIGDDTKTQYDIVGRTIFDMKDLYHKFVLKKQESYSLDHISNFELGVGKLENPYPTFKEFYTKDPQKFLTYNFIDTTRVNEVDKKQGLTDIAVVLTYMTGCTFPDVYSPVRYWECWIQRFLGEENTFVETKRVSNGRDTIPGAFVSEPVPGHVGWTVSIDATALYPSIMKCLNLSPETLVKMIPGVTVDKFLSGAVASDFDVSEEYTLAANGAMFRKDIHGVVPRLVDMVLGGRKIAKNEMLNQKQLYVDTNDIAYKNRADFLNTLQGALKVSANSFYGVFLQPGFMFYDPRMGSAITLTGQYIIQYVSTHLDGGLNKLFKTDGQKYVKYMDTDSCRGDSIVFLNNERVTIESLYNQFSEFSLKDDVGRNYVKPVSNITTKSFNPLTKLVEDKSIKYIMKHRVKKEMFEIEDSHGNVVVVTEDHSVIVIRDEVVLSIKPKDIQSSDYVISIEHQ